MARAHTTQFINKTEDYFTAHLNDGGVRIGFIGGDIFDIPAGHAYYGRVVEASNEMMEELHDELMSIHA
jgi:hypothetical protein